MTLESEVLKVVFFKRMFIIILILGEYFSEDKFYSMIVCNIFVNNTENILSNIQTYFHNIQTYMSFSNNIILETHIKRNAMHGPSYKR